MYRAEREKVYYTMMELLTYFCTYLLHCKWNSLKFWQQFIPVFSASSAVPLHNYSNGCKLLRFVDHILVQKSIFWDWYFWSMSFWFLDSGALSLSSDNQEVISRSTNSSTHFLDHCLTCTWGQLLNLFWFWPCESYQYVASQNLLLLYSFRWQCTSGSIQKLLSLTWMMPSRVVRERESQIQARQPLVCRLFNFCRGFYIE